MQKMCSEGQVISICFAMKKCHPIYFINKTKDNNAYLWSLNANCLSFAQVKGLTLNKNKITMHDLNMDNKHENANNISGRYMEAVRQNDCRS